MTKPMKKSAKRATERKPLECWVNVYAGYIGTGFRTPKRARETARFDAIRIAVHMREVVREGK